MEDGLGEGIRPHCIAGWRFAYPAYKTGKFSGRVLCARGSQKLLLCQHITLRITDYANR